MGAFAYPGVWRSGLGLKETRTRRRGRRLSFCLNTRSSRDAIFTPPRYAARTAILVRNAPRHRMVNPQMVMYEEEFNQIQVVVERLVRDANAKVVFIVDKNGQLIAAAGDIDNVDTTSLASLTAGNIAATGGMAKLLKEQEFATQFHEGEKANIHIQLVGNRVILVVIFDSKSSLGLVRLRVKKASEELNHVFEVLLKKVHDPAADSPFAEITDEDIDNLFND